MSFRERNEILTRFILFYKLNLNEIELHENIESIERLKALFGFL